MKIIIESATDLCEAENIVMMHDFCERRFDHEYAKNAVASVRKAIREYKDQVAPLFASESANGRAGCRRIQPIDGETKIELS